MRTKLLCFGVVAALCGALLAPSAQAVDFFWNVAGPADWNDGANWDTGTVPSGGGGNNAFVNNGGTAEISATIPDIQDPKIGDGAGNSGTLNHTDGDINLAGGGWMFVGAGGGTGTYNFSGGNLYKSRLYIGDTAGSMGTLDMSGTAVFNGDGTGDGELNVGVGGATGSASFSGDASVQTNLIQFGNTSSLTITDNTALTAKGELWFGNGGGNSSTADMDSGVAQADTWIAIGRDGATGVVNLSGTATLRKNATGDAGNSDNSFITLGGVGSGAGGTLNVSGEATVHSDTNMVLSESAGRYGIVNQSGGTVTLHDNLSNGDGFNDSLELDYQGENTGEYHLSGGTLNAETIDATTGLFDMTGGVLSATNFVGNLTQAGGTVAPGNSPGIMTITGDYSLTSGDLDMEIEGPAAGTGYDQLIVTGDVSLAGDLTLSGSYVPALGDSFTLIDNQGANAVAGIFTGLAEGATVSVNGVDLTLTYLGGTGNDVVLFNVPEPTTLALLAGFGLVGIAVRRRS